MHANVHIQSRKFIAGLRPLSALRGVPVVARDGIAGTLDDIYFHEGLWIARTLAVDPGTRLARRSLVPSAAVREAEPPPSLAANLTLAQIAAASLRADLSQRSARSLHGYAVEARDGPAGRCEDVLVDVAAWRVAGFVAQAPALFPGSRCIVPAGAVAAIDSVHRVLRVGMARSALAHVPCSVEDG